MRYDRNAKNGSSTAPVANMWGAHTGLDGVDATAPARANAAYRLKTWSPPPPEPA
jgi:hypothetical protein